MKQPSKRQQAAIKSADELKSEANRIRSRRVIRSSTDVMKLRDLAIDSQIAVGFLGQAILALVYAAVSQVERRRETYSERLRWMRDAIDEQERNIRNGLIVFSSAPFQQADDATHAHGLYYEAVDNCRRLLAPFNIYWEALHPKHQIDADAATARIDVAFVVDLQWSVVVYAADSMCRNDARFVGPRFDEPWKAWAAVVDLGTQHFIALFDAEKSKEEKS